MSLWNSSSRQVSRRRRSCLIPDCFLTRFSWPWNGLKTTSPAALTQKCLLWTTFGTSPFLLPNMGQVCLPAPLTTTQEAEVALKARLRILKTPMKTSMWILSFSKSSFSLCLARATIRCSLLSTVNDSWLSASNSWCRRTRLRNTLAKELLRRWCSALVTDSYYEAWSACTTGFSWMQQLQLQGCPNKWICRDSRRIWRTSKINKRIMIIKYHFKTASRKD